MNLLKSFVVASVICCMAFIATQAMAKDDDHKWPKISGEIIKVDVPQSSFQIKATNEMLMTFKTTPETEIEIKGKGIIFWDKEQDLSEMKPGQWLKIKYYGNGETKIAKDVTIYQEPRK